MQEKPYCPKCHSSRIIKNSNAAEKQRYLCKECVLQFTRTSSRVRPAAEKALALTLHTLGLSLNTIARLFHVPTPAVLRWVRHFTEKTYEKPQPAEAVIIELDEMWHYIKSKKQTLDMEILLS